jgi:hypothetical protein
MSVTISQILWYKLKKRLPNDLIDQIQEYLAGVSRYKWNSEKTLKSNITYTYKRFDSFEESRKVALEPHRSKVPKGLYEILRTCFELKEISIHLARQKKDEDEYEFIWYYRHLCLYKYRCILCVKNASQCVKSGIDHYTMDVPIERCNKCKNKLCADHRSDWSILKCLKGETCHNVQFRKVDYTLKEFKAEIHIKYL